MTNGEQSTLERDLRTLLEEVHILCGGLDEQLPAELAVIEDKLSDGEFRALLTEILIHIRAGSDADDATRSRIAQAVRGLVEGAITLRAQHTPSEGPDRVADEPIGRAAVGASTTADRDPLALFEHGGLKVRPVRPAAKFLDKEVPLTEGFANTLDIQFWEHNLRLKLDLENFRRRERREPEPHELREMLWPKGTSSKADAYKIIPLADDIAAHGVRTPPVIDFWGTAWDGNRRLAACLYVLSSVDYSAEDKERAAKIRVWQTGKDATEDQINAVVTALNFGEDFKLQWPEYVRARQVYDAYIERWDLEASRRVLSERDETRIRQETGRKFGIKTGQVTRFCKMVVWALDFEDFHREQDRDESEIASRTSALFQYFYELDSGRGDDKLSTKLDDDEAFRAIVFDLMFDGKFKNWSQIRELRRVYGNSEALDVLKRAHAETSMATGQALVNNAVELTRQQSEVLRQAGRADELARITKWLNDDVTLAVLRKLDPGVLREFRDAARAVDGMISSLVDPTVTSSVS